MGDTEQVDFDCPHCGMGFSMEAGEALFIDHVEAVALIKTEN